jgi:RNA polymerase primary sigma factor
MIPARRADMGHRPPSDRWYESVVRRAPRLSRDEENVLAAALDAHRAVIARRILGSPLGLAYLEQLATGLASRALDIRTVVEVEADARIEDARRQCLERLGCIARLGEKLVERHRLRSRTCVDLERELRALGLRRAHVDIVVSRMEAARPATAPALRELATASAAAQKARARLVEANLRLVVTIARRYANRGLDLPDLVQEGTIGLMRAIDRFDAARRVTFATYATWWVRQTIGRALENRARPVRLPGSVEDGLRKVRKHRRHLSLQQPCTPTSTDIAARSQLSVGRVEEITRIEHDLCQPMVSFEAGMADDVDGRTPADVIADESRPGPEDAVVARRLARHASHALRALAPRERQVLQLRYGIGHAGEHTLEDIGRLYGLTRQRILQIASKALGKLRASRHAPSLRSFLES